MKKWFLEKLSWNAWNNKRKTLQMVTPLIIGDKFSTKLKVLGLAGLSIATSIFNVLQPFAAAKTIESLSINEQETLLGFEMSPETWAIAFGSLWMLSNVFQDLRSLVVNEIIWEAQTELSNKFIKHIGDLSFPYRANPDHNLEATKTLLRKSEIYIANLVYSGLLNVVPDLTELFVSFSMVSSYFGKEYALAITIVLSVYAAFTARTANWVEDAYDQVMQVSESVSAKIGDSINNLDTVEYNACIEYERKFCAEQLELNKRAYSTSYSRGSSRKLGQDLILGIGFIYLFYSHVKKISAGQFKISDFILLNTYINRLITPINSLGGFVSAFHKFLIELEKTVNFLEEKPIINERPSAVLLKPKPHYIEFKNVCFKYPEKMNLVLNNISFRIKLGQRVAFVGETGSGKSTIQKLLFRFFDVTAGKILINGQDIRNITLDSLRKAIAIVPQDTGIFNRSIKENLKYANQQCSDTELEEAIEASQLTEFLKREGNGLDSILTEKGLSLSGGEKQRIAICRALLKKSGIYILDEATSSLDSGTESKVMEIFNKVTDNKTVITVAHRLSTIVDCDVIFVLEKGKIIQQGTHNELVKQANGKYAELWAKQSKNGINDKVNINHLLKHSHFKNKPAKNNCNAFLKNDCVGMQRKK